MNLKSNHEEDESDRVQVIGTFRFDTCPGTVVVLRSSKESSLRTYLKRIYGFSEAEALRLVDEASSPSSAKTMIMHTNRGLYIYVWIQEDIEGPDLVQTISHETHHIVSAVLRIVDSNIDKANSTNEELIAGLVGYTAGKIAYLLGD